MFYIIMMIVLGLGALIATGVALGTKVPDRDEDRFSHDNARSLVKWAKIVSASCVGLMVLLTVLMSATIVTARSLSIVTSFGQYAGTIQPGLNWTAPWADKESFSTLNQRLDLTDYDDDKGDSVYVTFSAPADPDNPDKAQTAGGGRGNISAEVAWRISEAGGDSGAKALWNRYVSFDRVEKELVKAKAQDTLGDIANNVPAFSATVNYSEIGQQAMARLNTVLRPYGIVVDSVSIKRIDLDPQTQASLQKIVDAINKTAAYAEEKKGADIQNQILEDRAKAGALEEKANMRFCLDIVNSWDVKANGPLPATFNCGLGSSASVLVGAK
jgi:regulator of protease activity HflC (stomatin/prohibitin superfamily)